MKRTGIFALPGLAGLLLFALLAVPATVWAQCVHLGGPVQCPTNPGTGLPLPPGSSSQSFVPGGTIWMIAGNGSVFIPQTSFSPFIPPVSGGGSSGFSMLPGGIPSTTDGRLALTFGGEIGGPIVKDKTHFFLSYDRLNDEAFPDSAVLGAIPRGHYLRVFGTSEATPLGVPPAGGGDIDIGAGAPPLGLFGSGFLQTTLKNPAQQPLTAPGMVSLLEEFAGYDDQAADGYHKYAEKQDYYAGEWRKLADEARRQAERNRQRADESRRDGREADARDWEKEAERDEERARERDREAGRLDGQADEQRQREADARQKAQERRDAAERAREQARQAERQRAEDARQKAEERARQERAERDARRAKEQAERAERQRAQDAERQRQREQAQREHQRWLDAQRPPPPSGGARGTSTQDQLTAKAKPKPPARKKEEEEEQGWLDTALEYGEKAVDWVKDKLFDKAKEEALERTGITDKIDDLGVGDALGKLGEGIEEIQKIKKLGDSMEAELKRLPQTRRNIEDKIDFWSDPKSRTEGRTPTSGTLTGKEVKGVVARMVEANQ